MFAHQSGVEEEWGAKEGAGSLVQLQGPLLHGRALHRRQAGPGEEARKIDNVFGPARSGTPSRFDSSI